MVTGIGKSKTDEITSLHDGNNGHLTNDVDIANRLNDHFLANQIADNILYDSIHPSIIAINEMHPPELCIQFIEDSTIRLCIRKLKIKKAPGLDKLPPCLFKIAEEEMTVPLADLFNHWIWSSSFPKELKRCVIVPVYKKGDRLSPGNYRPVSLIPVVAKLFEMAIEIQLKQHFDNLLAKDMFGFIKNKGCEHALLEVTEMCRRDLDKKSRPLLLALDLSRAFDVVSHNLLIKKLEAYRVDVSSLRLIRAYLSERTQCVRVNGKLSAEAEVVSGVPQGSIIGPLMFNIFVNDLSHCVPYRLVRYADDTTLYISGVEPTALQLKAEEALLCVTKWFLDNNLIINTNKTQLLLMGRKNDPLWNNFKIQVDNVSLLPMESIRILGVTLDATLDYDSHISNVVKKAGYALRLARCAVNFTSPEEKWLLLNSYIMPHLQYCGSLLVGLSTKQLGRLQRFLKIAHRSLKLSAYPQQSLSRIYMNRALHMLHQAIHANIPQELASVVKVSNSKYGLRDKTRIILPNIKTKIMSQSMLVMAAKAWNALPNSLECHKLSHNSGHFRNALSAVGSH
jgi:hypothetical protein